MSRSTLMLIAAAAFAFAHAAPVTAGIADSPLPELLPGKPTFHLYSVPGVIGGAFGLGTYFACTSTDTATMQDVARIRAEPLENPPPLRDELMEIPAAPDVPKITVAPGATLSDVAAASLAGAPPAGPKSSTATRKLACTAFVADAGNAPPTSSWQLTIIAKTKQKAAN